MSYSKILILNIFGVGDVLFTTPLIQHLKAQQPNLNIGYVANSRAATVLSGQVDRVFVYDRDAFDQLFRSSKVAFLKKAMGFWEDIRHERYDAAIDLTLNSSFNFWLGLSGIKTRVGFNYKKRSPWLTHARALSGYEGRPVADYYLALAGLLGFAKATPRPVLMRVSPEDEQWASRRLAQLNLSPEKPWVALVPGGGASWGKDAGLKRWPLENYVKLADKLIAKSNPNIILLGDLQDRALCETIVSSVKGAVFSLCGETSLGQLAAVLKRCALAVVNDGGPLHVAAAVGTKTVGIFGPVDEKVYGAYTPGAEDRHRAVTLTLPCRPCYRRFRMASCTHLSCLNRMTVEAVLGKVEELL